MKTQSKKTGHSKAPKSCPFFLKSNLTKEQLLEQLWRVEAQAREHTLNAALEHYLPGLSLIEPREKKIEFLRKVVFANWIEAHMWNEKFEAFNWVSR